MKPSRHPLSLRVRTAIAITATLVAVLIISHVVGHLVVLRGFSKIEVADMQRRVKRAEKTIQEEESQLSGEASDWAGWDDAYAFVQNGNREFVRSSIADSTFQDLRLDLMLFVHSSGRVVFGRSFDPKSGKPLKVPAGLMQHLSPGSRLLTHRSPTSNVQGVILLPQQPPLLIASRPIVTSEKKGPIRGALIMGRYLDAEEMLSLAGLADLPVTIYRCDEPGLPPDVKAVRASMIEKPTIHVRAVGVEAISGYTLLNDLYGKPALLVRVESPRDILRLGHQTVERFLWWLLGIGLVFGLVTQFSVERLASVGQRQRESDERYRQLVELSPDAIVIANVDTTIRMCNQQAADVGGYGKIEDVIGKSLMSLLPPEEHRQAMDDLQRVCESRRVMDVEYPALRKDGTQFPCEIRASVMGDPEGVATGIMLVIRDITERKRAEKALLESNRRLEQAWADLKATQQAALQQERLRALGQMASGIAHDFNNALSPVVGFSDLMLERPEVLEDREAATRYLQLIATGAKDAANVVARLKEFYRKRETGEVFLPLDLNGVIQQAVSLTQPKWKDQAMARGVSIQVETDLQILPMISGNESELREALTNIVFNATDTIVQKAESSGQVAGTIVLRTYGSVGAGEYGSGKTTSTPPQTPTHVVIEISDTGAGMDEETRERCLEPFFSTKGERGTGMGLSMVFGIVTRHEGTIDIRSEPGQGTTFILRLPVMSQQSRGREGLVEQAPYKAIRPLHILVVDDEPGLRQLLTAFLTHDGHTVETASNGREGFEKFKTGRYDMVLTDRSMPEMNGDQLASAIKQVAPQEPVIMLTGFGDIMGVSGEKPPGVDRILAKPTTLEALRQAIHAVIK